MSKAKVKRQAVRYAWAAGSRFGVPAQVAGEELQRIAATHGGALRPRDVWQVSQAAGAPFHEEFVWDDAVAGPLYRDEQARHLIRSVRVLVAADDGTTPPQVMIRYVAVRPEGEEKRVYLDVDTVRSDPDLKDQACRDLVTLLRGVQQRYYHLTGYLTGLDRVWAAIDQLGQPNTGDDGT